MGTEILVFIATAVIDSDIEFYDLFSSDRKSDRILNLRSDKRKVELLCDS